MRATWLLPLAVLAGSARAGAPVTLLARPFPLGDVQLLDSPFRAAMLRNADYLLSIEPDRLLHNTRQYAGLEPKGELYGGWEMMGIAGHTLGHYLTAISQQYAATGDERFKKRIDYTIAELALCQDRYGDGYIGALPPVELETMRGFGKGVVELKGGFNFASGAWVPWYTEHKVLNGIKDAWILGGSQQARAVAVRLADWMDAITSGLSEEKLQQMLKVEQGGMMDVLAEMYELTGNPRYLAASRRFYHKAVMDPLLARTDELEGLHANTQIPKVIGEARTYEADGDPDGRAIAEYFWGLVTHHYTYVIGGNSEAEHFVEDTEMSKHIGPATAETCNTYNMLKLTEHVFGWNPDAAYMDFYERALYNDILASQEPRHGMFTYFMSLEPGLFRTYSTPYDSFWCCVGTGMENHTKYGEAIYSRGEKALYVNLFIPSSLSWPEAGLKLEQRTDYPRSGKTMLRILAAPASPMRILVRCPGWASSDVTFKLNGKPLAVSGKPGGYAAISRAWAKGDRLAVTIPMAVRTEALADDPNKVAFVYGPAVLAADLGPGPQRATFPYARNQWDNLKEAPVAVPVLLKRGGPEGAYVVRTKDGPLTFRTDGIGRPNDLLLRPFWEIGYSRYNVYWDVMTDDEIRMQTAERKG
ncbi:MAG TPA: beta-L-arabinofuranosidase domain-containing protein [Opitutaceae bacterium]